MSRHLPGLHVLVVATVLLTTRYGGAIMDGTDATGGEFPWIAGIVRRDVAPPGLVGGGALIGDQWVITAAHSVSGLSIANLEVWLGVTDLGDAGSRRVFKVLAVYVHPDFATDNGTSVNDLALLLLDQPVTGIDPLPLIESESDLAEGDAVRVAGWGTSTEGMNAPNPILQKAPAEIVSLASAEASFGTVIEPVHLPAIDPDEIATPCVGDSGGPLVKNFSGTDRLAGVVSFGSLDCDPTLPTIYTRIPLFAPWITDFLELTAVAPGFSLRGKGRIILSGRGPRSSNGTDFGELPRPGSRRTRVFEIANAGPGLLTIRSASVTGRGFSLRRAPTPVIATGGTAAVRIGLKAPARGRQFRGKVTLLTNDPATPVFVFRVAAKVR